MIAKSKASEVGPAAGTYVKLQDAFYAEQNFVTKDADSMGYTLPGTITSGKGTTANFEYKIARETDVVWSGTSLVSLNDCVSTSTWTVTSTVSGSDNVLNHATAMSDETNCLALTPNFHKIGTGKAAGSTPPAQ